MSRKTGKGSRPRTWVYLLEDAIARGAQQGLIKVPPHLARHRAGKVLNPQPQEKKSA